MESLETVVSVNTTESAGVQSVDLRVGDAGDGNAWDHGDWAEPKITCTG